MTFSEALSLLLAGRFHIYRKGWATAHATIELRPGDATRAPWLAWVRPLFPDAVWTPSTADLFASDWEVHRCSRDEVEAAQKNEVCS